MDYVPPSLERLKAMKSGMESGARPTVRIPKTRTPIKKAPKKPYRTLDRIVRDDAPIKPIKGDRESDFVPSPPDARVTDPFVELGFDHVFEPLREVVASTLEGLRTYRENTPVYKADVDIDEIVASKPTNSEEKLNALNKKCDSMRSQPLHSTSCRIVDRKGKLILSYFSFREKQGEVANITRREWKSEHDHSFPVYEGKIDPYHADDHTPESVRARKDVAYDGIQKVILDQLQTFTQSFASVCPPSNLEGDWRHKKSPRVMSYPCSGGADAGYEGTGCWFESAGTFHLLHAWYMLGHETATDKLYPSSDIHGKTTEQMQATCRLLYASEDVAIILDEMFRVNYPKFHCRHKAAFKAGRWYADIEGAWLGTAIVYKLQTNLHIDQTDGVLPVAIFCLGQFEGGYLEMPDLNMRFFYRPGDVVITFTGVLYHRVTTWKSLPESGLKGVTPGRIAFTHFTPGKSLAALEDKEEGWHRRTMGGKYSKNAVNMIKASEAASRLSRRRR